jgi:hypothetical protein
MDCIEKHSFPFIVACICGYKAVAGNAFIKSVTLLLPFRVSGGGCAFNIFLQAVFFFSLAMTTLQLLPLLLP